MSKPKKNSLETEPLAQAKLFSLRCGTRKVALVAGLVRGKKANEALSALSFCRKRVAYDVKKLLLSAIANAQNNHAMDPDLLYVSSIFVGKDFVLKRFRPRAKGRPGKIIKEFSNVTVTLKEMKGAI
jgi:large subunit ribosomal protein L22